MLLVLDFLKNFSKIFQDFLEFSFFFILMVNREITHKTENTNTIVYVLLHWNNFYIFNLSHITSGVTIQI